MTLVIIVVVIVVVAALIVGAAAVTRRRRLQQRFGPEYDRLVGEHDSKLKAEAELKERQKRVHKLDIRPLSEEARASYSGQWAAIQERFVDDPEDAVAQSQVLVTAVMKDRGYPTEEREQIAADLSVEHASLIENYRAAEQISENATSGTASTEDLRQAMIHYRSMFRDLLGESAVGTAAPGYDTAPATTATPATTAAPASTMDPDAAAYDGTETAAYDTTAAGNGRHAALRSDDRVDGDLDGDGVASDGLAGDRTASPDVARDRAARDDLARERASRDDLAADDPGTRTTRRS
jgi:hypothetical protein